MPNSGNNQDRRRSGRWLQRTPISPRAAQAAKSMTKPTSERRDPADDEAVPSGDCLAGELSKFDSHLRKSTEWCSSLSSGSPCQSLAQFKVPSGFCLCRPTDWFRAFNAIELIGRGHAPPCPRPILSIQQSRQIRPVSPVRSSEMLGAQPNGFLTSARAKREGRTSCWQCFRRWISASPKDWQSERLGNATPPLE